MKGVHIGGVHGLLLTTQEMADILECVELYCIGATGPEMPVEPEIREQYPNERFVSPVDPRFWRLHAALANRKGGGSTETERGSTGG